jgi:hypothetical protein
MGQPVTSARVEDAARHLSNLLALVPDLATQAAEGCHVPPQECRYRTEELLAQLGVQARTERLRGFASPV